MGACLNKDSRRQRNDETYSRTSQKTIFQPEDPYANMQPSLAKPPQLAEVLEIRTFEEKSNRGRSSFRMADPQKKTMEDFLKNDSISVFMGSQIKSEKKQTPQKMTTGDRTNTHYKHHDHPDNPNCQCFTQQEEKRRGNYSGNLGANLQPRSTAPTMTKSALDFI